MADYTFRNYRPQIGGFIGDALLQYFVMLVTYGLTSTSIEHTTHLGFPSIRVVTEFESGADIYEFIWHGGAPGEECPARQAMMSQGFSFQYFSGWNELYFPPTWAALSGLWESLVVPQIAFSLNRYTTGTVGVVSYQEVAVSGGAAMNRVAVVPLITSSEVLILQAALYGYGHSGDSTQVQLSGAAVPAPMAMQVGGPDLAELKRVTEELATIARTSRITWINNQGGFADITTGDIVTEGGEG